MNKVSFNANKCQVSFGLKLFSAAWRHPWLKPLLSRTSCPLMNFHWIMLTNLFRSTCVIDAVATWRVNDQRIRMKSYLNLFSRPRVWCQTLYFILPEYQSCDLMCVCVCVCVILSRSDVLQEGHGSNSTASTTEIFRNAICSFVIYKFILTTCSI